MPTLDQLIKQVEWVRDVTSFGNDAETTLNDVLHILKTIGRTNLCPTCIVNAPEPYGCSDCLNTGLSEPLTVTVYVCFADDHDYDAMSQWLIGVYETEEQAEAAGKADEARYVREGGKRERHNVSIHETKLHLSLPTLKPDNELIKRLNTLETLTRHWRHGYDDENVTLQIVHAANSSLWQMLGVDNQTDAVLKLKQLIVAQP